MEGWTKIQSSFSNINFGAVGTNLQNNLSNVGQNAGKLTKGLNSTIQATKERLGQINQDDITELPQEYKDLEARVDALRNVHVSLLKITRVYETETYDYPTQIAESVQDLSTTMGRGIQNFAAANLKGTNLPAPAPAAPAGEAQHKTLPHALGRSATAAATALGGVPGGDDRLGRALAAYAGAWERVADARVQQDGAIQSQYLVPWKATLNNSIESAMKARVAVRTSRLELDAAKQTLKSASPARQEAARLEVENAEDDLVQKTEIAITLMKTVLDNPEPLKDLNELAKAQLLYYNAAAEALSTVQGEIEELAVAAEGEFRKAHDQ